MKDEFIREVAKSVYQVFVEQQAPDVYATVCCGRLYVGVIPAKKCRTCQGTPKCVTVQSPADLDNLG